MRHLYPRPDNDDDDAGDDDAGDCDDDCASFFVYTRSGWRVLRWTLVKLKPHEHTVNTLDNCKVETHQQIFKRTYMQTA